MLGPIIHPSVGSSFLICHSGHVIVLQAVINLPSFVQDLTALLYVKAFLTLMRLVPIRDLRVVFKKNDALLSVME